MKVPLYDLLQALSVDHVLGPYETCPWSAYDSGNGLTASAEVRMNPESNEIEAEVQLVYDTPPAGTPSVEHLLFLHARPSLNDKWSPDLLRIRKDVQTNKVSEWDRRGCELFSACVQAMMRNEIPDFDDLFERIFAVADRYGSGTAGGSGRKPSIKPEQLMDPTKRGF